MSVFILGIDPGFKGALALLNLHDSSIVFEEMPLTKVLGRNEIDPYELAHFVGANSQDIIIAAIEDVGARPKQGLSSTFRFGYGAGILIGVCASFKIPCMRIKPQVWKSYFGLSKRKKDSIDLAIKKYPHTAKTLTKKSDDGKAEALLLADFAKTLAPTEKTSSN